MMDKQDYGSHTARQNCFGVVGEKALVMFKIVADGVLVLATVHATRLVERWRT